VSGRWVEGNGLRLLENGEAFFPAVFDAIARAEREVIVETFILFEDKVGWQLHEALLTAARRGAQVDVMVDGFGSADLGDRFVGELLEAGVRIRTFDPGRRIFGRRFSVLRRMHRKIVVIDAQCAFVGGINYSDDHLADFGPQAKQDYAVEVCGPLVAEIRSFALAAIRSGRGHPAGSVKPGSGLRDSAAPQCAGRAAALFVTRDNVEHHNGIERHYRAAIRSARKRVLIANAYFFPGYLLLREMRRAARRGVEVRLILQGEPDMPIAKMASGLLYEHLQAAGVHIHEYCRRPLHGKVAVVDDDWATVGSSNLDPLSLSLNLEANVVIRDAEFAGQLRERLERLIAHDCKKVPEPRRHGWAWAAWHSLRMAVVFHVLRRFPVWATWLPRHRPSLVPPRPPGDDKALARHAN
jgi:cardiolipin synthase